MGGGELVPLVAHTALGFHLLIPFVKRTLGELELFCQGRRGLIGTVYGLGRKTKGHVPNLTIVAPRKRYQINRMKKRLPVWEVHANRTVHSDVQILWVGPIAGPKYL